LKLTADQIYYLFTLKIQVEDIHIISERNKNHAKEPCRNSKDQTLKNIFEKNLENPKINVQSYL